MNSHVVKDNFCHHDVLLDDGVHDDGSYDDGGVHDHVLHDGDPHDYDIHDDVNDIHGQGCISCGILVSGIQARGVS